MAKSRIIPSRALNNGPINSSAISPSEPISGEMNDQKVIIDGTTPYDGGVTNTAEVVVDNDEHKIYTKVTKLPAYFIVEKSDGTIIHFDGSNYEEIKLNDYTIEEIEHNENELKRYALIRSDGTPVGDTIIIPKDEVTYEVRDEFGRFVFEDNAEVSYNCDVTTGAILIVPENVKQGFISLLTIRSMESGETIEIRNESSLPTRIVRNNVYYPGNTYTTKTNGKKIIFARCDGLTVEILIIEETVNAW